MARIIDALSQFSDGNGQPLAGGFLEFFENETSIEFTTFNDPEQTVDNPQKVPLDGEGRMSLNAYASVLLTVKLFNSASSQVESEDNVTPRGGLQLGKAFENWVSFTSYVAITSVVTGSDGEYYKAKQNSKGIDPVVDFAAGGENWKRVYFNEFWSEFKTYADRDRVTFIGDLKNYISVKSSNLNNDPSVDTGANWELDEPALDWVIGKTYAINEKTYSKIDSRLYKAVISQAGNEPSVDDGTNWLPVDGKVTKPTNVSPANLAVDVPRSPTLVSSAYAVTGSTAVHEYSDYNIYLDAGKTNLVYSSDITNNLINHTVTDRLEPATEYFFELLHKGIRTDFSEFSDLTSFTTTIDFSEVFDNVLFNGIGSALSVITTVNLNVNTGSVWIANTATVSTLRLCDTVAGPGNAIAAGIGFNEVVEVNGLTAFNFNGFSVGTDVDYNNSGDSIFSLSFKVQSGIHDIITTTGNATNRTVAHSIGKDIAFMLNVQLTGASPGTAPVNFCWFKDLPPSQHYRFNNVAAANTDATVWNSTAPTSSVFSLGTSAVTNGTSRTYKTSLWAHNPAAGLFGGSYTGDGLSGNKIFLGDNFNPTTIMWKPRTTALFGGIFDKEFGTSSHLQMSAAETQLISGGPQSFDSDGFTVGGTANNVGVTYDFFAMSDPDLL